MGTNIVHPFLRKLRLGTRLSAEDEATVFGLLKPYRKAASHEIVQAEGTELRYLPLIVEGWACCSRMLENGKRQIVSLFVPGDLCEPFGASPHYLNHSITALTPITFSAISMKEIGVAARSSPRIYEALWGDLLKTTAIEREFIVSLGVRSAVERLGHLFCELHLRLNALGMVVDRGYNFPLTQTDLGDALGLSTVHVNRSLKELRKAGWISLSERHLMIHDFKALQDFSFFDPAYLHLNGMAPSSRDQTLLRTMGLP